MSVAAGTFSASENEILFCGVVFDSPFDSLDPFDKFSQKSFARNFAS